jgi:ABC-type molybdate transport system substrate-binding protein
MKQTTRRRLILSLSIILAALGLTYAPMPGLKQSIVVVSGTELQEPLTALESRFKTQYPQIELTLKFQGSQDMVNNYLDDKNDFKPTVLIPSNEQLLKELESRWRSQNNSDPFYDTPRPITKTLLVAVSWPERGRALFADGRFSWERLEQAIQAGNWNQIDGNADWGSFDFVTTDPMRSYSGQLTLTLWTQAKLGSSKLTPALLNNPVAKKLFSLIRRSVYQAPRSTDILLQEFIARGANDADIATVYESIALYRWQQSATTQDKPYQIYYIDPTVETTSTAAIVRREVDTGKVKAARQFLDFLNQSEQQRVFVQYGFRPVNSGVDLLSVPNSPWQLNIPGAEVKPTVQLFPPPELPTLEEIKRLWERSS